MVPVPIAAGGDLRWHLSGASDASNDGSLHGSKPTDDPTGARGSVGLPLPFPEDWRLCL
jgi:hypothetical protein